jgi:vitamin B12 transporter
MLREAHGWQIAAASVFSAFFRHLLPHVFPVLITFQRGRLEHYNRKYKMKKYLLLAAFLCALSPLAQADTDVSLDEIVVTATRLEQPLKQTLSTTSVITQEDIKNSQATDVLTILRSVAGVEISQNGGIGKTSSLFLRGSNDKQVLVLLDGVRISSATAGTTSIEHIMLNQIERIEIVRGNVSSLYGSEAIGGVVQIFTKRGHGEPAFNMSAGIGSHGTQSAATGFGGSIENTSFNVQLSRFITEGVSTINPAIAVKANPDNNGYDNTSVSANVRHAFNSDNSLSASIYNSQGHSQFDSTFESPSDVHNSDVQINKLSLTSENKLNAAWLSKLQLAQGVDYSQNFTNGMPASPGSIYKTTNQQLNWQNELNPDSKKQILLGAEYLGQQIASDLQPKYVRDERKVNSLFAGYTGKYGSHQLQMNARQDNFSDFGIANTGLLGYGYNISDVWRVAASTSTAFKAPTMNDMFYPFVDYGFGYSYQGNPNLQPERSHNNEMGVHYADENQRFDMVYFDNRIHDLIAGNNLPAYTMINLNEARIDGVETSYSGRLGDTDVRIALTQQNPRDANTGQSLLRRAKFFSNVGVMQQFGKWKLGGEWQYSGEREDLDINTYNRTTLDSYSLVNLTSQYRLDKQLDISLRVDNLFNQDYMLAHGYNTLGRTLFVNMSYQQ